MRKITLAFITTFLTMTGMLLVIAPASNAGTAAGVTASCDGAGCNGLDPIAAGCSADAYTPNGAWFSGPRGTVELRYSPTCHSNWARISSSSPGTWFYVQNYVGDSQQYWVPSGSSSAYSNMVNGYPLARAGNLDNHTGWY